MTKILFRIMMAALPFVVGCATPGLQGVLPYQTELMEAQREIASLPLPPSRFVPSAEWHETLSRVARTIAPTVRETCLRTGALNCSMTGLDRISLVNDPTINAFVDEHHRIGIHTGLVERASSDAEIAAVLAHEYGHILAGHIGKRQQNAGAGVLAGFLIDLAVVVGTDGQYDPETRNAGGIVGEMAYSQQFELEADYYAALILENAGIDLRHGRNVLLRLARESRGSDTGWNGSAALMANTHPSNDWRLARWNGISNTINESKQLSPSLSETELMGSAVRGLFFGETVAVGNLTRWINPHDGSSGMATVVSLTPAKKCQKTCASYRLSRFQQGNTFSEVRFVCWKPGGDT